MRSDTASPSEVISAVERALQSADTIRAIDLARTGLDQGVMHPLLLNLRAYWLETQEKPEEALKDLRQAHTLAPRDPTVLNALGLCLAKLDRRHEAVAAFAAEVEVAPDFAAAHYNLGWASVDIGELAAARASFERALELNPRYSEPLARLAELAVRQSEWTTARAYAEKALGLDPFQPTAIMALANVNLAEKQLDTAEALLRSLTADTRTLRLDLALAYGLLGDVLDAQNRATEVFAAYREGNEKLRQIYAPQFANPRVQTMPEYVGWIGTYFQNTENTAWAKRGRPSDGPQPAFLVGFPRSGTTLLEQILASHPRVTTLEEKEALAAGAGDFMDRPANLERLATLDEAALSRYRDAYWKTMAVDKASVGNKVIVDKLPLNTIKLPLIAKLFPGAKILFAVRDPRDVVLSCFRRRFRMNPSMYEFLTLEGTVHFYASVMRLTDHYRARLPLDIHQIRYEDLVDDFERQTCSVCAFIGIDWDDEMRRFSGHARERSIATPSSTQVARGLYREGMGQWRRYMQEMAPVMPVLAPWIEKFGYNDL